MHKPDKDIASLEALLGEARDDYQKLRHGGADNLVIDHPVRLESRRHRLRVVASVLVATVAVGFLWLSLGQDPAPSGIRLTSAPTSLPDAPSRPTMGGTNRPALTLSRPTLAFELPQLPSGSNG